VPAGFSDAQKTASKELWSRYPANYDNNHPHPLVLAYHWSGGSAAQVLDCNQEPTKCSTTQGSLYWLWDLSKDSVQ
jgi:hypothetical protein